MSQIIYDRAAIRERSIWPSFLYLAPNTDIEAIKITIFGLYANSYLLGHKYLEDIELEELQRLIDIYDTNILDLNKDEQNLVLEIASKRYLKTIEIQIRNNVLITKTHQLDADQQEYEAKLEALEVDQEALNTKRVQIELVRDRVELKNQELESKIQLEVLAQQYVEVEILQKQLEASRAELKVLLAKLRGYEIQLDIANVSLQIVTTDLSKSQITADIAGINARIANQGLLADKLSIDSAELDAIQYEINLVTLRQIALLGTKGVTIQSEITNTIALEAKEVEVRDTQVDERNTIKDSTLLGFDNKLSMAEIDVDQRNSDNELDGDLADLRQSSQILIATKQTDLALARRAAAQLAARAAIAAATTLSTANIATTLSHEIGRA